jgi:D-alanyl-D-alanine carboxypeptidase
VAQYVIGGMDRAFKARLYHLFRALDDAGLAPGMTSGFRDDYRQSIASGNKAAPNRSYHGGSLRGGYGHGLAADIVSVNGETRFERSISSEILWKWIDAHGKEYGIGRPYLDKDPPHIAPIDGQEYADKRGLNAKIAEKGNAATSGVAKAAKPRQALQGRAEPKPLF